MLLTLDYDGNIFANQITTAAIKWIFPSSPKLVIIPEIRLVGNPAIIKLYLSQQGLSPETINRLMSTATRNI